jgi:hypothetical protein
MHQRNSNYFAAAEKVKETYFVCSLIVASGCKIVLLRLSMIFLPKQTIIVPPTQLLFWRGSNN